MRAFSKKEKEERKNKPRKNTIIGSKTFVTQKKKMKKPLTIHVIIEQKKLLKAFSHQNPLFEYNIFSACQFNF